MTTLNCYASLDEYKDWCANRGLAGSIGTDASDDVVMESILKGVSRYIDNQTGRSFVPHVETRYFDVPGGDSIEPRLLRVDGDLLEVLTLTNGDGTVIPSTEYSLRPKNKSPHYGVRLVDNSTYYWASDGAGDTHDVISILGVWGYHNDYGANAWLVGSTLNEELDTTETGITVTSGTPFVVGNLIRFENELGYVSVVATNDLTSTRGANGSTAAAHDTAKTVYIWQTQEDIKQACLMIAQNVYGSRTGQSSAGKITVTASGVVIRPEEVPALVQKLLTAYRDIT